ncbi:MAG: 6-phosphogluconolactonase [Gaiellaceae bacterium]
MSFDLIVLGDAEAAATRAGELLAEAARDGGHIALSGGKTPERAHETAVRLQPDWGRVEVWWGDERCVAPDDERSNFAMAKRSLLDEVAVEPAAVHRIRGELDPTAAAAEYDAALRGVRLRMNVLGLGPDGHTASLFPDAPGLRERERLAIAADAGLEPFVPRVTMTPPMLANADCVLFLVTGEEKADAVKRAFEQPPSDETPSSRIRSRDGQTLVVLDAAAASKLARSI